MTNSTISNTGASGGVVTLTFSPALDVSTDTDTVVPTRKLRCSELVEHPGGGGVNVARVASRLGASASAVVPLGGRTGSRLAELLHDEDIELEPIEAAVPTRQSFSVTARDSGDQYRFVMPAPTLSPGELDALIEATARACEHAGCLVVSGRTPEEVPDDIFERLVDLVAPTPVIVDTSGPALQHALHSGAALVKPSASELGSIVGNELQTEAEILDAVRSVAAGSNVSHLVASIGSGGAFAVGSDGTTHRYRAPAVKVRSAIGAGDSMIAGIAVALCRGDDPVSAIASGIATGTAAVLTDGTGLCHAADAERLRPMVVVELVP